MSDIGHSNPLVNPTGVDNVDLNIYTVGNDEIPPKRCSEEFTPEEINPQDHHFDMPDEEPVIIFLILHSFYLREELDFKKTLETPLTTLITYKLLNLIIKPIA